MRILKSVLCLSMLLAAGAAWAGPHDRQHFADGHDKHEPFQGGHAAPHAPMPHVPAAPLHHQWGRGHGNIRYFPVHDWGYWHRGYWRHGWYGPRFGWWWVVSGVWFYYPAPVYPYPNPYVPPGFDAPPPPSGDAQPATQYWYYCPAANGYYPYISTCPGGWQQVLPTPPDADQGQVPGG